MTGLSIVSPDLLQGATTAPSAAEMAKRGDIQKTAEQFEASFLGIMLQSMFKDVKVSEPFGGGDGEDMWKTFMTDAMAKSMTRAGGIGLAAPVAREMLKLQGLTDGAPTP
jgi:Rod binding domain-containing protein